MEDLTIHNFSLGQTDIEFNIYADTERDAWKELGFQITAAENRGLRFGKTEWRLSP